MLNKSDLTNPLHHQHQNEYKSHGDEDKSAHNASSKSDECVLAALNMAEHGKTSDRLFQFDADTVGLISSSDSSFRLFDFSAQHATLTAVRVKYFKNERPYDACADQHKNVYIVFPDENKIGKYHISQGFVTLKNIQNSKQVNKKKPKLYSLHFY